MKFTIKSVQSHEDFYEKLSVSNFTHVNYLWCTYLYDSIVLQSKSPEHDTGWNSYRTPSEVSCSFLFSVNEVQYKSFYFCSMRQVAWPPNTRRHDLCDGRNMATTRIKVSVSFLVVVTSLCAKREQMNRYIRTLHLQHFFFISNTRRA